MTVFAATSTNSTTSASATTATALHMAGRYGAQFTASVVGRLTGLTVGEVVKIQILAGYFYSIKVSYIKKTNAKVRKDVAREEQPINFGLVVFNIAI